MAELLSAIQNRYSCRSFTAETISDVERASILEAGRIAPSGFGMEPWRFVSVQTPSLRRAVAQACFDQPHAVQAPLLIVIVALPAVLQPDTDFVRERLRAEAGAVEEIPQDLIDAYSGMSASVDLDAWAVAQCNFAAAQMMIQTTALGLASCAIGGFDQAMLTELLALRMGERPALVLAIGHCAQAQGERRRRALAAIDERR